MPRPENRSPQSNESGFSGAHEIHRQSRLTRLGRMLRGIGVTLGVTTVAAVGAHTVRSGSGESYTPLSPDQALVAEPTTPVEGSPTDTEQLHGILEQLHNGQQSEVKGLIGAWMIGQTNEGPLILENGVVLPQPEGSQQIVVGGETAAGQEATYVLDARHFTINRVNADGSFDPVAQSYQQAKAMVEGSTRTITIDQDPNDQSKTGLIGSAEIPTLTSLNTVGRIRFATAESAD